MIDKIQYLEELNKNIKHFFENESPNHFLSIMNLDEYSSFKNLIYRFVHYVELCDQKITLEKIQDLYKSTLSFHIIKKFPLFKNLDMIIEKEIVLKAFNQISQMNINILF